jgi:hypothetical protein
VQLSILDTADFSIIKFPNTHKIPPSFHDITDFKSITYTKEECSIIVPTNALETTAALAVDSGWFVIQVVGVLDFSLVGILVQLANPLAENKLSIFAVSTYNTDYLLIKNQDKDKAIHTLQECGHTFI